MKRPWIEIAATLVLLGTLVSAPALAGEAEYAFGGGGPGFGLFMPSLDEINGFLNDAGYAPLEGNLFLIGGSGRGGTIPGTTYGGGGWGAWITSRDGNLHAEYGVGLGGFDLGYAVGGSERSVLTVGALMGAGAGGVTLTQHPTSEPFRAGPQGLVIEPIREEYGAVFAFVAPYLDMQIQLLPWMGLGLRAGYLWSPVELDWSENGQLSPPKDLSPSGLYLRCSILFGGIGQAGASVESTVEIPEAQLVPAGTSDSRTQLVSEDEADAESEGD